jgi:hypothetical protein
MMSVDAAAVQQLMLRYADTIDADDIEAWPDFFTPDGEYTVISRESLRRGHRIGYGAGYYDLTIAALRRVKPVIAAGILSTSVGCEPSSGAGVIRTSPLSPWSLAMSRPF